MFDRETWRKEFSQQLDIGEKAEVARFKRYYNEQYKTAIDGFLLDNNPRGGNNLFKSSELENLYVGLYSNIGLRFAKWYAKSFDRLISKRQDVSGFDDVWSEGFAEAGRKVAGQRIVLLQGTAKAEVIKNLQRFMQDPEFMALGADQRGRILRSRFNKLSKYQAERIVRTEATYAANLGAERSAVDMFGKSGLQREWLNATDARVRDAHNLSEPQIREMDEPFNIGGELLMMPGDPRGSARNVVNCRCAVAHLPKPDAQPTTQLEGFEFGMAARTVGLEGGELVAATKPTREVAEEVTKYPFKPKNWDEFSEGSVKDESYLGFLKRKTGLKKTVLKADDDSAWYSQTFNEVVIDLKRFKSTRASILAHEFAHAVAHQNKWIGRTVGSINPKIKELMSKQSKKFIKRGKLTSLGEELREKWGGGEGAFNRTYYYSKHKQWRNSQRKIFLDLDDEQIFEYNAAVADWLGSLTTNKIGWGHDMTYMKRTANRADEFIAHSFENKYVGNPIFKHYFPKEYDEMLKLIDELTKDLKYDLRETFARILKSISQV